MCAISDMHDEILNNIWDLNCGGCGIFAYLMVHELRKYAVPAGIVYYDNYHDKTEKDIQYVNNIRTNKKGIRGLSCSHLFVSTPAINFDGYQLRSSDKIEGYQSLRRTSHAIAKGMWCDDYDRCQNGHLYMIIKKYAPKIAKQINKQVYDSDARIIEMGISRRTIR